MRRFPALALILMMFADAVAADTFDPVRQYIRRLLVETPTPSISVAVARKGRIGWEEGFGWADLERRVPATEHSLYLQASISKPITVTGLMTLVAKGKADLDRPANDYLGDAKLKARIGDADEATLRRLASHSAGLPAHFQYFFDDEPYRQPPMDLTILRYGNLVVPPGEQLIYSNLGMGVLGYIIERTSGQPFADYMRQEVFAPLGMHHTSVRLTPALEAYAARPYDLSTAPLASFVTDTPAAAEVYSSAHDLARFGLFHLKNPLPDQAPILPGALIDDMQRPHMRSGRDDRGFGLGWQIVPRNGYQVVTHGGGLAGVSTLLALIPSEQIVAVVLINRFSRVDRVLVGEIFDQIMRAMVKDWHDDFEGRRAAEPPVRPTGQAVGVWEGTVHTGNADVPLVLDIRDSGEVRATLGRQPVTLLTRWAGSQEGPDFAEGRLRGSMTGDVGTSDTQRNCPCLLDFDLTFRGGTLNGGATVGSDHERPYIRGMTMTLTHWTELRKK